MSMERMNGPLRVGIGGPVGAGKTTLTEGLARALAAHEALRHRTAAEPRGSVGGSVARRFGHGSGCQAACW